MYLIDNLIQHDMTAPHEIVDYGKKILLKIFRSVSNILSSQKDGNSVEQLVTLVREHRFMEATRFINNTSSVEDLLQAADSVANINRNSQTALQMFVEETYKYPTESNAKENIFFAGLLTALGRHLEASDALDTAQKSAPVTFRNSLSREAYLLRPRQVDGQPPKIEGTNPIVILDPNADVRLVGEWLERYPTSQIVTWNDEALPYLDHQTSQLITLDSIISWNPGRLNDMIQYVEKFSEEFVSALDKTFLDSPAAQSFLAIQRPTLKASMRKPLMGHALRVWMIHSVLERYPDTPIVTFLASTTFLENFKGCLDSSSRTASVAFMTGSRDRSVRTQIHLALDNISTNNVWPHQSPPPRQLSVDERKAVATHLTETFDAVAVDNVPPTHRDRCVVVVRGASHSVAKTLATVVSTSPADIDTIILSLDNSATRLRLTKQLNVPLDTHTNTPLALLPASGPRPAKALDGVGLLTTAIWFHCGQCSALMADGLDITSHGYDELKQFATNRLWTLVGIHRLVRTLINGSRRSVVVVIPGAAGASRLLAAQYGARDLGCRSIDLRQAYMSTPKSTHHALATEYYYSVPHGDIVTVIDQWSADLLVENFQVNRANIRIIGTPLFDAIVKHSVTADAAVSPGDKLSQSIVGRPLVLLATQPGMFQQYVRLLRLMATINIDSVVINVVVKLHPHESDTILNAYREQATEESTNNIQVIRDVDLNQLITQADVVVTIYSNVGIEAAIAGKQLIVANLEHQELPFPLDKFKVGLNAYSELEFTNALCALLLNSDARDALRSHRSHFFEMNPNLKNQNSTETLWALLKEQLTAPTLKTFP